MFPIAHSELLQVVRNRAVLINGLIVPLVAAAYFIYSRDMFQRIGSLGYIGSVIVFTIAAFTLYATTVTTLAGRRQTLFLKRLRSTAVSDPAILSGLVLPLLVVAVVQVGLMLVAFSVVSGSPANVPLLMAGIGATFVMMLALGTATSGVTNSPEAAQVTSLPLSLGIIVVANWVAISGTEEFTVLKRLLPGGAASELIVDSWNGGTPVTDSLLLLVPTFGWVLIAIAIATRLFRWEPRR